MKQKQLKGRSILKNCIKIIDTSMVNNLVQKQRHQFKLIALLIAFIFSGNMHAQTQIGSDIDGESFSDQFGRVISLNADGSIMAVGGEYNDGAAPDSGHVRIFQNINNNWLQIGADINGVSASDFFGSSVALSADGNRVVIGALGVDIGTETNYGTATVYDNIGNNWVQVGSVLFGESQSNQFGTSVSISDDGSIIAVGASFGGASNGGYMRTYTFSTDWVQLGQDIDGIASSDFFGVEISLSADGTIVAVSASGANANTINNSGQVQVYQYNNSTSLWEQLGQNMDGDSIDDFFGQSLSLSSDGTRLIAGARSDIGGLDTGLAKIYEYNNSTNSWVLMQNINGEAVGDRFGTSASISADGNRAIVGARYNDGVNGVDSGHARVFEFNSGTNVWEQLGSDIDGEATNDESGYAVSINSDGTLVAIGARYNDADDASSSANFGHARAFSFVNLAPIAVCQDIIVQLDAMGNATILPEEVDGGSSDPEGSALSFSVSQNTFDCSNLGTNIVTLTVTDAGLIGGDELTDTCTATVTVVEEAPVANCTDVSIYLDENGMASITTEDFFLNSTGKLYGLIRNSSVNNIALFNYDASVPSAMVDDSFAGSSNLTANGSHLAIDINPVNEVVYLLKQDDSGPTDISNLYSITLQNGTLNPVLISSIASVSGSNNALGMSFGADGTLYFAFDTGEINAYNIATSTMSVFALVSSNGFVGRLTTDLKNNRLIHSTVSISSSFSIILTEIDLNTGVVNSLFTVETPNFCKAQGIEYVGNETIIVSPTNGCNDLISINLLTQTITGIGDVADTSSSTIDLLYIADSINNATLSISNFTCADIGDNTVTVSVSGSCGTVVTCDAIVTIVDSLPVIECPSDMTFNVDPGMCDVVVNFNTPVSPDNCAGSVTVTQTEGMPSGSSFSAGLHIIEFTATDLNGITTICSFTIFVQDNIPPSITCAGDVVVDNDLGLCGAAVTVTTPTLVDNCGTAIAPSTGLVNFNFDANGELIDTPGTLLNAITASSDVVLGLTFRGDLNGSTECFELNDPDGNILFSECDMEGACSLINRQVTVPLVTWNTWITNFGSSFIFTLIANDNVDSDQCEEGEENPNTFTINVIFLGTIQLTNDFNQTADASGFYPVGDTVVTWTATDIGGNNVSCIQTITVIDAENPVITCPTDITVVNAANECDAVVTYSMPTATDNCSSFNTSLESILSNFNGNSSSVTALIPNAFDFILDNGLNSDYIDDGGNDMYDDGNYISTDIGGDITYSDNLVISETNFGTNGQFFSRKVEDMWLLAADLDGVDSFNIAGELGADGDGTATGYTATINVAGFNYNIFAKRVNEDVGRVDSDSSINHLIIIPENVNATHNFVTDTDDDQHQVTDLTGTTRLYYLLFASIDSGVVDDATMEAIATSFVSDIVEPKGPAIQTAGLPSGSTFPLGTTTNTFEVTDEAGNTTTCSFDVIVSGTESPVINCPVDFEVNTDSDYTVLDYEYTVTDDCSSGADLTIVQDPVAGTMVPTNNLITVSITATDAAGNETVCNFDITVSPTLGNSEFDQNLVQLFPNPASTTVTVKNLAFAGVDTIVIYDIAGRVVQKVKVLTDSNNMTLDVSNLSNATYFVEFKGEQVRVIKKLIVK
ncbi:MULTISPECIES: HYR domain-containing protein [Bizionia]|uniref:HYR domain-containing protein n=1 Tax=Bizionia algoritergicola TaxID=291187 RepID=A0A5D0R1M9_9FLAO|nr:MULTISPECIES: HYR domain-containing protein [Bizionia]OBX23709.1 hypothetical protein BAA08_03375 [Bizionia sp. APA-3]TYB75430.1 HYR domain-containing protein [Bizionia algoritergicola]